YMSAVSKKVMPASSAALTTASVCFSSIVIPKLLHPRPTTDTDSEPIFLCSIIPAVAADLQVRRLATKIRDVTTDRLRTAVFDRCAGERRGDRVLQVV